MMYKQSDMSEWLSKLWAEVNGNQYVQNGMQYLSENPNLRNSLIGAGGGALLGGTANALRGGSFMRGALGGGLVGGGAGAGYNAAQGWANKLLSKPKTQQFDPKGKMAVPPAITPEQTQYL